MGVVLPFLIGSITGIFTGIAPGIHVNLASALLVSNADDLAGIFSGLDIAVLIVAMATVHTFLDVIPSVFLGAPSEGFAVAVLPGHRLLLAGMGYEAVRIATAGAVIAGLISIIISPILYLAVPIVNDSVSPWIAHILIASTIFLIFREKGLKKRLFALLSVLTSAVLGLTVLSRMYLPDPLLPLLSGLFGASTLILSIGEKNIMPAQFVTENISIPKQRQAILTACAVISGWLVSLLPGVGSAQAAILSIALLQAGALFQVSSLFQARISINSCQSSPSVAVIPSLLPQEYLFLVGGIGTVNFVLSIISMATIGKARNGAIAAVMDIIPGCDTQQIILLMAVSLAAIGFGAIAALITARFAVRIFKSVPYALCCILVLAIVALFVLIRSGIPGFAVFITSSALGILTASSGIARIHLMACLTAPVVVRLLL